VVIPGSVFHLIGGAGRGSLFGFASRYTANQALKRVCQRHGLPFYSFHKAGRHSFASRLLREGKSLKFVAEAGGWASIKMPAEIYGHLEKSDIEQQVKESQERWSRARKRDD
jgi:site-specific recombinase XerD